MVKISLKFIKDFICFVCLSMHGYGLHVREVKSMTFVLNPSPISLSF